MEALAQSALCTSGRKKLSDDVRHFLAVRILGARPSNACLQAVFDGGRLARSLPKKEQTAAFEVNLFVSPEERVCELVGCVGGLAAAAVRDHVLSAAHTKIAFLDMRLFSRVRPLP